MANSDTASKPAIELSTGTYCCPSEVAAYTRGREDGTNGLPIQYHALATTWPNAYHHGYWEGVYDREFLAQQGERDAY